MVDAVETMAYAGEVPWHGLGKKVLPDLTPDQMLVEAGLNWEVNKFPLITRYNKPNDDSTYEMDVPTNSALIRSSDNKILSIVSNDWEPVQNIEAFEFFHDFVMEGDMEMHTAGSLRGGKNVWALAKVKDGFSIGKDETESYLLFSNPHEYGRSIDIRLTPIRVVCWNTLSLSLQTRSDLMVKLNHRKKFDVAFVKKTMGLAKSKMETYKEMAEFLATRKATSNANLEYMKALFPSTSEKYPDKISRPATTALRLIESQPGADLHPGTWWNTYNAVTFMVDHIAGNSAETRLDSAWYGANRQKKLKALELAVEMAEAA